MGFEIQVCSDSKNNEKCTEILEAVKEYVDSKLDWNPKIVFMGVESMGNITEMKELTWLLHPALDIVGVESWQRRAGTLDPTEEEITDTWRHGLSWDWQPDPPDLLQVYSEFIEWVKKPVILNFGFGTGDGNAWRPWGVDKPNVQDQEEQALSYKVTFDLLQDFPLYGWAMEHYSFAPSNTTLTGCFRETMAEEFIKAGLDAHSKNFSLISGKFVDKYENPVNVSTYAYREGSDVVVDNARADMNGSYSLEVTPGVYDILFKILDFFVPDFSIKVISMNVSSSLYNLVTNITQHPSEKRISFIFNGTGNQTIQVYSPNKPESMKINQVVVPYDENLTSTPSWNYNETSKMLTIKFSVES
jgi:hypothetical protein